MHSISSNSCVVETAFRIQQPNNFTLFKQSNTRPRSVFLSRSTAVLRCVLNAFLPPLNRRCKSNTRCLCRSSCRSRHTVYPGRDGTRTRSVSWNDTHTSAMSRDRSKTSLLPAPLVSIQWPLLTATILTRVLVMNIASRAKDDMSLVQLTSTNAVHTNFCADTNGFFNRNRAAFRER